MKTVFVVIINAKPDRYPHVFSEAQGARDYIDAHFEENPEDITAHIAEVVLDVPYGQNHTTLRFPEERN